MYHKLLKNKEKIFAVAPMMDWTDRHCRFFHRTLTSHALLYSEMITADAIIHGDRKRLIDYSDEEHPLALQLGGCDVKKLCRAAQIGAEHGYDEINLNVGCPSERVRNGTFGACLMLKPQLVASCVAEMKASVSIPVTVKCRIGVDHQDPQYALNRLADCVFDEGCDALWVHARKAWLQGLSPKQNRTIPSLNYDLVYSLKQRLPEKFIGLNGGITTLDEAEKHLIIMDGVMLGRAAYQNSSLLCSVDQRIYHADHDTFSWGEQLKAMQTYCEEQQRRNIKLYQITRHMIGLFHGRAGAKRYRQILSEDARLDNATPEILQAAFNAVMPR